jgi:hypothetical protein
MVDTTHKRKLSLEGKIALILAGVLAVLSVVTLLRHVDLSSGSNDRAKTSTAEQKSAVPTDTSSVQQKETATTPEIAKSTTTPEKSPEKTASAGEHTFTAAAGDSYTGFARQAVDEYADAHNLQLTDAERLDAEVALANDAGAPYLEIGQNVTIADSAVAAALPAQTETTDTDSAEAKSTKSDDTKTQSKDAQQSSPAPSKTETADTADSSLTAAAGDSYTTLARAAIAKASERSKTTLNAAQKVAAETYLSEAAGFPALEIGQDISLPASAVDAAIAKAAALSAADQAAWQTYADDVIF